jgi:hypothetical protein
VALHSVSILILERGVPSVHRGGTHRRREGAASRYWAKEAVLEGLCALERGLDASWWPGVIARTWRPLSGRGARRERPAGTGQEEPSGLRQGVQEGVSRSMAKAWTRRGSTGMEKRCPRFARHLLNEMTCQERCPAWCSGVEVPLIIVSGRFSGVAP